MIYDFWRRISFKLRQLRGDSYGLKVVADVPRWPKANVLYLERRGDKNRWLHFLCPSGCGETISVNLMKSIYPHWAMVIDDHQKVTLFPSINKGNGCRSHFFLRKSKIEWALPS